MEKLESAFLGSKDLIGIGKFHPGTSEESWSAFSLSIPTPSLDLGSFSTGFGYPQIQTFLSFASKLSWDEMLNAKECLFQQWEYVGEALGVLYGSVQRLQNANSKEERWQKYFITAFLNWRSSPCNRVQYFFGRDRNCYPWKIPLGGLGKGMFEASHCVFRNQTVALSWFAFATQLVWEEIEASFDGNAWFTPCFF